MEIPADSKRQKCHIYSLYVETGPAWSCAVCIDYDLCNACYLKVGNSQHPHGLYNHPSPADCDEQNDEARLLQRLTKMLDLVAHASQCRAALCPYHGYCMMRRLFHHEIQCKTRAHAGCALCRRMWFLLQLHARACKESVCHVPRCRDLKELVRMEEQQSDSQRGAAMEE